MRNSKSLPTLPQKTFSMQKNLKIHDRKQTLGSSYTHFFAINQNTASTSHHHDSFFREHRVFARGQKLILTLIYYLLLRITSLPSLKLHTYSTTKLILTPQSYNLWSKRKLCTCSSQKFMQKSL